MSQVTITKAVFFKQLKTFIASSQKRREVIQTMLVQSLEFARQWDLEPLTRLWTAIEELRSDDRRAILTWITLASGGYEIDQATLGHSINAHKSPFHREKGATTFKIRKLNKAGGETQSAREAQLDRALAHYRAVKWFSLTPEKTESAYKFGLDQYIQRALAHQEALAEKDRLFLRDVLRVAQEHGRDIKVPA